MPTIAPFHSIDYFAQDPGFMLIHNSRAMRATYPQSLRAVLNVAAATESHGWLKSWPMLAPDATPCWTLPDLAASYGIAAVCVKDEAKRSSLESFKALGAPVALVRLVLREFPDAGYTPESLFRGEHATSLKDFTVVSATDGNHGRALAAGAQSLGCRCVIIIHRHVSEERRLAIERYGAVVIRIDGTYDESVQEAARLSSALGWHVVADTSYEGNEAIPRDVMQGYGAIAAELIDDGSISDHTESPYSHIFIQGGVGGLAAGVVSYLWEYFGERRPVFIMVEPDQADCLYQSALHGIAAQASGSVDSVMAGLACGDTSPLAWRFLDNVVDFFMTISDQDAVEAMKIFAAGSARDIPIVSGESGAAGLAGLNVVARESQWRDMIGLNASSRVLLINTEGATAPELYAELAGCRAETVLATQRDWVARQDVR